MDQPFAATPDPPYVAVIFTSLRTDEDLRPRPADRGDVYAEAATRMEALAAAQPGYLGLETAGTTSASRSATGRPRRTRWPGSRSASTSPPRPGAARSGTAATGSGSPSWSVRTASIVTPRRGRVGAPRRGPGRTRRPIDSGRSWFGRGAPGLFLCFAWISQAPSCTGCSDRCCRPLTINPSSASARTTGPVPTANRRSSTSPPDGDTIRTWRASCRVLRRLVESTSNITSNLTSQLDVAAMPRVACHRASCP